MVRKASLLLLAGVGLLLVFLPTPAFGYPVEPLPEDNLIANPWFRSSSNPSLPGFDGWIVPLVDGIGWGLSQKESNPSPEVITSGTCGNKPVYCGTGARWANEREGGDTTSYPGVDVYMYQVVQANPADRQLKYFMHWVNHRVDIFEVTIFGGAGPEGPWLTVWQPIVVTQDRNPPPGVAPGRGGFPWFQTEILDTILGQGFPFYKIELHARYPESNTSQGDVGVKVTGVYFAAEFTESPESLSTPAVVHNPTVDAGQGPPDPEPTDTPQAVGQAETELPPATAETISLPTNTPPPPTEAPTERVRPTQTPTPEAAAIEQTAGIGLGFLAGLFAAGLVVGILLFFRLLRRTR